MPAKSKRITSETVRDDFNSIEAVIHYTRAAHSLGLWESERNLIERFLPDRGAAILEAGCGAGRVTLGLWELGYRNLTAFDFAEGLLEQAISLAEERAAAPIRFVRADAAAPETCQLLVDMLSDAAPGRRTGGKSGKAFDGALFMFNGLMQLPGRENRRAAMRGLHQVCKPGAPFLFTTHDRDDSAAEKQLWAAEREAWRAGRQDPRLVDFGDRYMESADGRIFMHLPDQAEIREDLSATGWECEFTAMRREIARESHAVRSFSDECRFWVARRPLRQALIGAVDRV